jgi:hypothetical protein
MPAARVVPFDRHVLCVSDAARCDIVSVPSSEIDNTELRLRMNFRADGSAHEFLCPARMALKFRAHIL